MKAVWNNHVIAETDKESLIHIEGNWYFPPDSVRTEYLSPSSHSTTCFWKGESSYYDIAVDGEVNSAAAWYYPAPMDGALKRVGKDFANYVAFWHGVTVQE